MIEVEAQLVRDGFTLDVSFSTDEAVTGLFGHSGAGKSTLISIIAGLVRPDQGRIVVDGEVLFDHGRRIDLRPHRRRVGVVFQEHRLFPHLSVDGNLRYGHRRDIDSGASLTCDQVVDLLEIASFRTRRVNDLSGGERQRVALGRALLSGPRVLLLDEPLASLDRKLRAQILPFFDRLREFAKIPMLYVSHELAEILRLTDRLLVLERGRLVGDGRFNDLVHEGAVLSTLHHRGMTNLLPLVVEAHDDEAGMSTLRVNAQQGPDAAPAAIAAPRTTAPAGSIVHVSILPSDIALATSPISSVSIQNQLPGVIRRCSTHGRYVLVEIDIGGASVVAEVSLRSHASLGLAEGRPIRCLIKSHAFRYLGDA